MTNEQIIFLTENYKENTLEDLVLLFNEKYKTSLTKGSIRGIIDRNKIRKEHFEWRKEMDDFLMGNSNLPLSNLTKSFNDNFSCQITSGMVLNRSYRIGAKIKQKKRHIHTKEEIEFILKNSDAKIENLVFMVNEKFGLEETRDSVYKILSRNGKPRDKQYHLNDEEYDFIKNNFSKMRLDVITSKFNEKFSRNVSSHYIRTIANNRFGIKKTCYSPKDPLPIGTEKISNSRMYVKIQQPNVWKLKSRIVYEQETGKSADGLRMIHLDGNLLNFEITNLVAIDMKTHCMAMSNGLLKQNHHFKSIGLDLAKLMVLLKEQEE